MESFRAIPETALSHPPAASADLNPAEALELKLALALLAHPRLGPRRYHALLRALGSLDRIFGASVTALREACPLLSEREAEAIARGPDFGYVEGQLEACAREKAFLLPLTSPRYPAPLRNIEDPPPLLYGRGTLEAEDRFAAAVVGTRQPSRYGLEITGRFAGALAEAGLVTVSGLALGIDGAAHEGALRAGGRTLAVVGTGLEQVYPRRHAALARAVEEGGAVLSEYPFGYPIRAGNFPRRNRLISALSLGVVVVEAAEDSGALITARFALDQGREVFAVPGNVFSAGSKGAHDLLRQGAHLATRPEDLLEVLAGLPGARPSTRFSPGRSAGRRAEPAPGPVRLQPRALAVGTGAEIPGEERSSVEFPLGEGPSEEERAGEACSGEPPSGKASSGAGPFQEGRAAALKVPAPPEPSGGGRGGRNRGRAWLDLVGYRPLTLDEIAARAHRPVAEAMNGLFELELMGRVEKLPGGRYRLPLS